LVALKPFQEGWLSDQTCELVPLRLYETLEQRAKELENKRMYSAAREQLQTLCGALGLILTRFGATNGADVPRSCVLNFIDHVLTFANIEHPDPIDHSDRLAALVFQLKD
jgi:hypothetical protein